MPTDDQLFSADGRLEPVRPVQPPGLAAWMWLLVSWLLVIAVTAATGPFRSGFGEQLLDNPRFALEVALGISVGAAAIFGAFRLAVPSGESPSRALAPALVLAALWVGAHVYGTVHPSLPPSMAGKREFCFYETFAFALVPVGLALFAIRRRYALEPARAALLAGLAGTALPATIMQVACMADPWHILSHHLQPVAWLALACALLGSAALRPR